MDIRSYSDEKLVLLCQQELPEYTSAFNELVRRYKDYVFDLTITKLKNVNDAEDATQETFIRIFHGLKGFRMDSELKTWITVIAGNVCLTMLISEKRKFWKYHVSLDGEADLEGIHTMLVSQQQEYVFWKKIGAILHDMFTNYRKVFIFKYFKNFPIKLIADKINSSLATAKMRITRAKDQFLKIFLRS
jgi:RNA polymerase sigma-70 factor (ECF subfamily)